MVNVENAQRTVDFQLNGSPVSVEVAPGETLLETLSRSIGDTSVRGACDLGVCGVCSVLVDGLAGTACLLLTQTLQGREVVTPGVPADEDSTIHQVRAEFVREQAFQCSYCIPAMVLNLSATIEANQEQVSEQELLDSLDGNLCRCGCYASIGRVVGRLACRGPERRP